MYFSFLIFLFGSFFYRFHLSKFFTSSCMLLIFPIKSFNIGILVLKSFLVFLIFGSSLGLFLLTILSLNDEFYFLAYTAP